MDFNKILLTLTFLLIPLLANAQLSDAPEDAEAYIISPVDQETVSSTFTVQFGLKGMGVAPAGVDMERTGHHHLLIDVEDMPDLTRPLPSTDQIVHFGLGQTETELTLPAGEHTLQLILGDFTHTPHKNPVISDKITIYVE